ncbi:MAG: hypothetical protein ACYDA8_00790 [Deferrisomatales bacterium]
MKIHLPNSAHIVNIGGFLGDFDPEDPSRLEFTMHERWVSVHPVVLAMSACAAALVRSHGGTVVSGPVPRNNSVRYPIRMGLFQTLGVDPGLPILEHEEAGRFVPLTQLSTNEELRNTIVNLVPLLHAPPEVAQPIKYVFSEMVRNALEHSLSKVGAFVCAQYYRNTQRISIGIADAGRGILESMRTSHPVGSSRDAIALALQPGITGVTSRLGGNEFNAGAGLFFTKSIAALSRNFFFLYSGDAAFKLLRGKKDRAPRLNADPRRDYHRFLTGIPAWPGTVVGIDINVQQGADFSDLLDSIRQAYSLDVKHKKKEHYRKIKFT